MLRIDCLGALLLALGAPTTLAAAEQAASGPGQPTGERVLPLILGEIHTINSRVMGSDRRVVVRLPAGYTSDTARRYNVVYVIDGGPEQDFPHLAGLAQSAEVNGTFEPFILVGIETVRRRSEITPPASDVATYEAELGARPGVGTIPAVIPRNQALDGGRYEERSRRVSGNRLRACHVKRSSNRPLRRYRRQPVFVVG